MAEVKIIVGDKTGKSYQKVIDNSDSIVGRALGETIKGDLIGFSGYEFLITGGSDHCGFPMRKDVKGSRRVKILANSGTGIKVKDKGIFLRKTVVGDTVGDKTTQINLKITKQGSKKIEELFGETKEETKDVKADEKKD
ncbi:MAG: 30S ribosomal protein S6e [Nanoarchaeota archaeon]|nr:30S ribosomal protein S6e [Nanoarchaeota archaeon]